jgi:hypothetical protein
VTTATLSRKEKPFSVISFLRSEVQNSVYPPSTTRTEPVMKLEASLAR